MSTLFCFILFNAVFLGAFPSSEVMTATDFSSMSRPLGQKDVNEDSTLLCQINGTNWFYTSVRGRKILSTDYKPRKKFVLNFTNENSPANENITLMYHADTKQLEYVDIALQDPSGEKGVRIFVGISGYTEEEMAQIKDMGVLTNITEDKISGTAKFLIPKKSKGVFKNELDKDMVISDLQFEGIPYEDESDY